MKCYYVANARMPTEKAHGIQIAKMCEALIERGVSLALVVPRRGALLDVQSFYNLRVPVPLVRIPVPDWYGRGRAGFLISSAIFMLGYVAFLGWRRIRERFVLYAVDMDTFSYCMLPLFGPAIIEMHTPKRSTVLTRFFFKRTRGVVATNTLIREALAERFALGPERLLVEPNGVDLIQFRESPRDEARRMLGLPMDERIALYVGRAYGWKGLSVLSLASQLVAARAACYLVGATAQELEEINASAGAIRCMGPKRPSEVPVWVAASDVVLVLGTRENQESYSFTSPMKVYEYAAAGRPIVASATPALRDMLGEREAFWYEPDNAQSLAGAITEALGDPAEAALRAQAAKRRVAEHSWSRRAERILGFLPSSFRV